MKDISDMSLSELRAEIERLSALLDEANEGPECDALYLRYDSAVRRLAFLDNR